jgi:hypothetical protein
MDLSVDDEWTKFLTNSSECDADYDDDDDDDNEIKQNNIINSNDSYNYNKSNLFPGDAPTSSKLYISTQTKIAYLKQPIDLNIFWNIPIIPYSTSTNGVIKKEIKLNSKTPEDLQIVQERLQNELFYKEHIMSHIDNPNGRIKFKDIRKITIGISKKDIMSYRSKTKQAFYNCFVMILRINIDSMFREFHIKVFNTGKLEIPGVQSEYMFETVLNHIIDILQPYHSYTLSYKQTSDTVLINSNFNCGFFIRRQELYDILRSKYNIHCIYDPCCPYPGIQCKFYYNNDTQDQKGIQIITENKEKYKNITKVSFMIFRTGSVLIVGMCNEHIINNIYEFLTKLLKDEFKYICQELNTRDINAIKDKKKKIRKKFIYIMETIEENTTEQNLNQPINIEHPIDTLLTLKDEQSTTIIQDIKEDIKEEIIQDIKEEIIQEIKEIKETKQPKKRTPKTKKEKKPNKSSNLEILIE